MRGVFSVGARESHARLERRNGVILARDMDWRGWLRRGGTRPSTTAITPGSATATITGVASTIQAPSRWLSSHLPNSLKWLARFEWFAALLFGIGMIQVDEYLLADICWIVSFLILLAKVIVWQGPAPLRVSVGVVALMTLGVLIIWTGAKKSDKAWSVLTAERQTHTTSTPKPKSASIQVAGFKLRPLKAGEKVRVSVVVRNDTGAKVMVRNSYSISLVKATLREVNERKAFESKLWTAFEELNRTLRPDALEVPPAVPGAAMLSENDEGPVVSQEFLDNSWGKGGAIYVLGIFMIDGEPQITYCGFARAVGMEFVRCVEHN